MKPVIALVGQPNVGKSTLFNRLTRSRDALVDGQPGITRDRIYGNARVNNRSFIIIDTGGLDDGPDPLVTPQVLQLLLKHQVKATFFVTGKKAAEHPELIKEILLHGHSIGNASVACEGWSSRHWHSCDKCYIFLDPNAIECGFQLLLEDTSILHRSLLG